MKIKSYFIILILTISIYTSCKTTQTIESDHKSITDMTDVSYISHIKSIISNNCISCHSGSYPSAGMALDSYEKLVHAVKNRGILKRINKQSNPMPTSGLMSENKRLLIQKWVDNNFAKKSKSNSIKKKDATTFITPNIKAVNIDEKGFDFLEKMQGHWVGKMFLLGQDIPWFAFDFRAIGSSQVHGLFEGGSIGNLFNTFFVAEYKGVKTIMLRNGGVLGGIYRTSYFVLTEVNEDGYLFEDAYGGKQIMWMKVSFENNKMKMLTYTSKFGTIKPSRHMEFNGTRYNEDLYKKSAKEFSFPSKKVVKSFPKGMPISTWGKEYPIVTSASYLMAMNQSTDYITLGKLAQDPIQITDIKNIASLEVKFDRNDLSKDKKINVYFSREPLTNSEGKMKIEYGYISEKTMRQVILFSEIDSKDNNFTFTYLHTGKCYITFVVDNNNDLAPSKGDFYSESIELNLTSNKNAVLRVHNITKTIKK